MTTELDHSPHVCVLVYSPAINGWRCPDCLEWVADERLATARKSAAPWEIGVPR